MLTTKHQLSIPKNQPSRFGHQRCYHSINGLISAVLKNHHKQLKSENMSAPTIHGHKDEKICNEQNGQGSQNTSDIVRPMLRVYSLYKDSPDLNFLTTIY